MTTFHADQGDGRGQGDLSDLFAAEDTADDAPAARAPGGTARAALDAGIDVAPAVSPDPPEDIVPQVPTAPATRPVPSAAHPRGVTRSAMPLRHPEAP